MNDTNFRHLTKRDYFKIFKYEEQEGILQRKIQEKLSRHYKNVLSAPIHFKNIPDELGDFYPIRNMEDAWNMYEEEKISCIELPRSNKEFLDWYQEVNFQHKAKVKPFFDYLSYESSLLEIAIYICLEEKVDGSFDDTIALAQLGVKGKAKMVMADNYWDEMGNGHEHLVHTTMFAQSADYMKNIIEDHHIDLDRYLPTAALKNGNILSMYSLRRRYIPRLLGAIGILEDTASERFTSTVQGLERFNLPKEVIQYHKIHIHVDSKHGEEWLEYVLLPSINEGDEDYRNEVCKGVLIRFNIASSYYNSIQEVIEKLRKL